MFKFNIGILNEHSCYTYHDINNVEITALYNRLKLKLSNERRTFAVIVPEVFILNNILKGMLTNKYEVHMTKEGFLKELADVTREISFIHDSFKDTVVGIFK